MKYELNSRAELEQILKNNKGQSVTKKKCRNHFCAGSYYKRQGVWQKCNRCGDRGY